MGIASRHRLLLVLQRSVCRFKGASLHEFQVHVAVAGIGRKALGGAKILLDRGAAADGEAIRTSVLGYELKTAVGTSVFIMTFTALTGAVSHFAIGGAPDWPVFALCVLFTLLWARIAAVFANKADAKTLNRATGIVLVVLGIVVMGFNLLTK